MNSANLSTETERTRRVGEAAAFRARVDERLRALDAEVAEIKLRINGLLFFIGGTVIAQVILKVIES
jgi:hypothetical protein